MATARGTIDFLVEQGSSRGPILAKAMFGEYALYFGNKLVALVCDDQLFVKPTEAGRRHIGTIVEASPYPGGRASSSTLTWPKTPIGSPNCFTPRRWICRSPRRESHAARPDRAKSARAD